ncbi:hypothetical protein [Chryseolinea lacunae]|uniref:Uncharacterized protein n=1 Tax=Chryseolinea lacunae TaxID=2801331 RepID=A0ABS1KT35_9BACT|nr:hypothetical protein [Chryseolinea lacunae]MBL0742348.1 hypothetical protein [Chryseolinea lacunae]
MKKYRTDIVILAFLLFVVFVVWLATRGHEPISIQAHDTYYIVDKTSLVALILSPITVVIFLVRAGMHRFKLIGANVGLIIGLILFALVTYAWVEVLKGDLNIAKATVDVYSMGFVSHTKAKINLTWALFGFWTMCIGLLSLQTVRLQTQKGSSR